MKILILGIVASGKTTLARRLSKESGISYYEIDSIVHDDENHRKRNVEEQREIIEKINDQEHWILEGTLRKNLYFLFDYADQILYINLPLKIRKKRIFLRFLKQKLHIEKCNYKPSIKMLKQMYQWTKEFETKREKLERELSQYSSKLITLESKKQVKEYHLSKYL